MNDFTAQLELHTTDTNVSQNVIDRNAGVYVSSKMLTPFHGFQWT
jgi:hypothetical protein